MSDAERSLDLVEALDLSEAASAGSVVKPDGSRIELGFDGAGNAKDGGLFDAQGRVPLRVIRPGVGKGKGSHLYEAAMLEKHANVFSGWPMYIDHRSEEARKAAGYLPRSLRDKGGIIKEAWWDPSVPANPDAGHGEGAVMAMVRPIKAVRELIDDDPALVEASISAVATGVKPATRDGKRVWLVEGIHPKGSVDFVSEAGAGGKVHDIWESSFQTEADMELALCECMTDDEVRLYLNNDRPELLEALTGGSAAPPAPAKPADHQEDDVEITKEQLTEALQQNPAALVEALTTSDEGKALISEAAEAVVDERMDVVRAAARADAQREVQVERLERRAHKQIEEAALPPVLTNHLKESYSVGDDGTPSAGLNVFDDVNPETGEVTRRADEKLTEAIETEIKRNQDILAEAAPTFVRGQGPSGRGGEGEGGAPPEPKNTGWGSYLQEHGIDPAAAYGIKLQEAPAGGAGGEPTDNDDE